VVGCDGRHAITRQAANLEVLDFGVPIDVLWFRISRRGDDPEQLLGNINYGRMLVLINRGDYFQAGLLLRKGTFEEIKQAGLDAFRKTIAQIAPYVGDRLGELKDWNQISLLSVQLNRLRQWSRPGLLCIGDAAHAMSPVGGVGINLAIQDAVATANLLADALRERRVTDELLAQVQHRREFPTRVTQQLQMNAHKVFAPLFRSTGHLTAPWQFRAIVRIPGVQRLMGRVIGLGIRPEHVREVRPSQRRKRLAKVAVGLGIAAAAGLFLARKLRRAEESSRPTRRENLRKRFRAAA
jgi:2-polyprenyl-6-methoxyphenol hydroxylase-like FAD-dependent oxidoreductase